MRRIAATALAVLLLLVPTAAFAQDAPETPPEEPTALETFLASLGLLTDAVTADLDPELVEMAKELLGEVIDSVTFAAVVNADEAEVIEVIAELSDDPEADEDAEGHGEVVSRVAECAPNGQVAKQFFNGYNNHGKFVSAAANGTATEVVVPVLEETEDGPAVTGTESVPVDLGTLEGAEVFCGLIDAISQAAADLYGAEDAREAAKMARDEARDEAKAERDAAKAERDAARAERAAAKGKGGDDA